jgi:hypothetical protein
VRRGVYRFIDFFWVCEYLLDFVSYGSVGFLSLVTKFWNGRMEWRNGNGKREGIEENDGK